MGSCVNGGGTFRSRCPHGAARSAPSPPGKGWVRGRGSRQGMTWVPPLRPIHRGSTLHIPTQRKQAMRTIGLIGGMSWESTVEYYRLINRGVRDRLGPLHSARLLLDSLDF